MFKERKMMIILMLLMLVMYMLSCQCLVNDIKSVPYRINKIVDKESIIAIRLRHIAVLSEELANDCKNMIVTGSTDFSKLADFSICINTKHKGGDTGWINTKTNDGSSSSVSIDIIPPELINAAFSLNKGDIIVTSSRDFYNNNDNSNLIGDSSSSALPFSVNQGSDSKVYHVVQLLDVMSELSPSLIKRRRDNFLAVKGIDNTISKQKMTYTFETMGCQMNFADTERMEGQLQELGYIKVDDDSDNSADVVVLNTCAIRDHAEQKVYSKIGPYASKKRNGEDVSIIVAGCVAQQEGEQLARRFPEIDIVMGPQYAGRLSELMEQVAEGSQVVAVDAAYQTEDSTVAKRKSEISAWVNVIYGCNERCTYCVVPNTRGVEQSRTKEAIIKEVQDLVNMGYREITLLGQNVDSWGRDFYPKQKFADLLTAVGEVSGIDRIRFLTSHPKYMSPRVIEAVAKNPKLMPNFNVPFQAGSNEILQNMKRGYTIERYMEIINNIRTLMPDAAIVADCIVGFPGETEEQFQETLEVMKKVKFEQLNTAAYSPRPNTPAALWENQIPEDIKQDRLQRINRLGAEHALERSLRFVNRIESVLVEDVNIKNPKQVYGRIPHGRLVYFDGNLQELKGKIIKVKIIEAKPYSLVGSIVDSKDIINEREYI